MKIRYLILFLIILFSAFIRLYKITSLPPALYYDEVDAGYQAMVFNHNLTDYYGNKFPSHFHSFGDYRTSLHIYSIALVQRLTNNLDLSVRLPPAIFGILSILIMFLITKSLISSFLLAISPWAIHYSRIGFEVSGMILFILLGIYFWQNFLKKQAIKYIYLTITFFGLSVYFYSTAKLFIIIIAILIAVIWRNTIMKIGIKALILPLIFSLLVFSPMIIDTFNGKAGFRFSYISIFTIPHREQVVDTLRYQDATTDHPNQIGISTTLVSSIFHNKYQLIFQRFVENYISSFSSEFLFLKGDNNARHGFGNHGLLYLIDFIFICIGLFSYFFSKTKNKLSTFFFWVLIFSPIPYSLTRDTESPHATRLILMLPSVIYFSYLGIKFIQQKFRYSILLIFLIYCISFFTFWHYYYYHYPQESARSWNSGMKEAVIATNIYPDNTLVFSDNASSFVSFFLLYHPYILYPQNSLTTHLRQLTNPSFSGQEIDNKYYFGHIDWTNLSNFPSNTIYIIPSSEYTENSFKLFQKINYINRKYLDQEGFYLLKLNE